MEKKLIPYITSQILFSRLCDRNRSLSQNGADEHARYGSISNDMRKWFLWKIRSQWIWKFCSVVPETITSSRVAVVWWIEGTALLVREKTPINVKFKRLAMVASHVCHKKGENTCFYRIFWRVWVASHVNLFRQRAVWTWQLVILHPVTEHGYLRVILCKKCLKQWLFWKKIKN